jgi:hypothetical protein
MPIQFLFEFCSCRCQTDMLTPGRYKKDRQWTTSWTRFSIDCRLDRLGEAEQHISFVRLRAREAMQRHSKDDCPQCGIPFRIRCH